MGAEDAEDHIVARPSRTQTHIMATVVNKLQTFNNKWRENSQTATGEYIVHVVVGVAALRAHAKMADLSERATANSVPMMLLLLLTGTARQDDDDDDDGQN